MGAVSPDDRYLAYNVRNANIANPPRIETGLFDFDRQSGTSQRLGPELITQLEGALDVMPIPGRRAVMITGKYTLDEVTRLYACDLDSPSPCVPQLPDELASWQVVARTDGASWGVHGVRPTLSQDGARVAVNLATPDGPGLAVLPVRLSADAPAAQLLGLLVDDAFAGGQVATQRQQAIGFADGLGVIHWEPVTSSGATNYYDGRAYALDLQSGQRRELAAPPGGWPDVATQDDPPRRLFDLRVADHGGRVILDRSEPAGGETLILVEPGLPDEGLHIADSESPIYPTLLPGGTLLLYGLARNDSSCELHIVELVTRRDTRIEPPPGTGADPATSAFSCAPPVTSADGTVVLLATKDSQLLYLDTGALAGRRGDDPLIPLALPGPAQSPGASDISNDGRRVLLHHPTSISLFDVARPERVVPLHIPSGDAARAALTPDGRFVLAHIEPPPQSDGAVPATNQGETWYRIDAARPEAEALPLAIPITAYPLLDPSGQYVAYTTDSEIRILQLDAPDHSELVLSTDTRYLQFQWVP